MKHCFFNLCFNTNFQIQNTAQLAAMTRFSEALTKKSLGVVPEKDLLPMFTISEKNPSLTIAGGETFKTTTFFMYIMLGILGGLGVGTASNFWWNRKKKA